MRRLTTILALFSAVLLALTVAIICLIVFPKFRKTREEAFQE